MLSRTCSQVRTTPCRLGPNRPRRPGCRCAGSGLKRAARPRPGGQAAVEDRNAIVAEHPQHPPEPRCAVEAHTVVDDQVRVRPHAQFGHAPREELGRGQHAVGGTGPRIANRVQIGVHRTGNVSLFELGLGVPVLGGQMPCRVDHLNGWILPVGQQPGRGDDSGHALRRRSSMNRVVRMFVRRDQESFRHRRETSGSARFRDPARSARRNGLGPVAGPPGRVPGFPP